MAQESGDATLPKIEGMRVKYHNKNDTFLERDLIAREPIALFSAWFHEACNIPGITEANAACLATSSLTGHPSARFVLLKDYGKDGFTFFTNYNSRKAQELDANPHAAMTFYWEPLHRSIRIEGKAKKVSEAISDAYWNSRPFALKIGSCASRQQSAAIASRDVLVKNENELKQRFEGQEIPRPPHWGGYIVVPESIEFWYGQSDRLHDRIVFRKKHHGEIINSIMTHIGEDGWVYERLSP